jgi:hypothetical protein
VAHVEKITVLKRGARAGNRGRHAAHPEMELQLFNEFTEMRRDGKPAKRWWFVRRAKQILDEKNSDNDFQFSNHWFERFQKRYGIALRRKTHCSQKAPSELEPAIKKFHSYLSRLRSSGDYEDGDIANMDQTPLPFILDDGKTYDIKGVKEVWAQSGQSGLDKRQATVQLTVFADGIDRVRPTLIFKGKGLRIATKEKQSYDKRVRVMFQEKAWCDEEIMKEWINTEWSNPFTNLIRSKKILLADVHRAQQTDGVKALLTKKMTSLCNIPPGCTSRVQVVDVMVNKPFKDEVRRLFEDHLDKNLESYVEGKISASARRVLMTKWVGAAWSKVGKMKESIVRSFKKCGLSVALDGSEDHEVNIEGIPDYQMPKPFVDDSFRLLDDDDTDESDVESEYEFDFINDEEIPLVVE